MSLFWHAVRLGIASPVSAGLVVGIFGWWTATAVTARIEKAKTDAQKLTEQAKIDSQVAIEKQRLEFQRDSETQKQRMELYKALYMELIAANNRASTAASQLLNAAEKSRNVVIYDFDYPVELAPEGDEPPMHPASRDYILATFDFDAEISASEWILGPDVNERAKQFDVAVSGYHDAPYSGARDGERARYAAMLSGRSGLSAAISAAMLNDDLSRLLPKST